MTKAQLIAEISRKTGIERVRVEAIVEAFIHSVKEHVSSKQEVYLRGFGSFIVKKKAAKIGRNIATNTAVRIPEHYAPAFKPSKQFKARVVSKGVK